MARRRSRAARKKFYSLGVRVGVIIALSTIIAFSYVWFHIQTVGLGYRIKKEEARLKLYRERSDALKLKVSRLRAPRRIERLMGGESQDFVVPDERCIVRMKRKSHTRRFVSTGIEPKHNF